MSRPPKKKDPFAALPESFKDKVAQSSRDELRDLIAQITKDEAKNQAAKRCDQDLMSKKDQYEFAGQGYREETKLNKLKVKKIIVTLSDKGDGEAQTIVQLNINADAMR